ncbi:MAG TPA: hypothetical protein VH590_20620 [Ktedonobacterales bacterium]
MRFLRLPILMVLIALASTLVPNVSFLLRFVALMLATLTVLGALSDMQRASRQRGMNREELLSLWFGSKRREAHTWEALKADVAATAAALRLPPPSLPALTSPDPINNGNNTSGPIRVKSSTGKTLAESKPVVGATPPTLPTAPRPLWPLLRLLGIEALSEAIVIATIVLNWIAPPPGTSGGELGGILILGLLTLGLLWFDWRLLRRFVASVQIQLAQAPA